MKFFNTTNHAGVTNNVNGDFYMLNEEKEIYKWLDAPDSSGNFLAAREKHHDQTGTWFVDGEEYLRWKETPDSALWVYGTPGCGKTIICSTIIEKIRAECAAEPSFACAYFFFDGRDAQTDLSLHNKLLRSIIKQLSHQSSVFPASLVELYAGGQEQPSTASLQLTLQKIIDGFERAYIIIDAVDECIDREKVLQWIEHLTQRKTGNVHVLLSSRPERDIEDQMQSLISLIRVTLNGKPADKDIETYLDAMLSKLTRWDKLTIARVRDALIARSDGMFRWVALQISELSKCRTRKAVDDQLRNLPKDLEGMYERSLLNSPDSQDLKRFLMWLAFCARPLEPAELADVVTVDFSSNGPPSYDPDLQYFGTTDMLLTCSSFVTATEVEKGDDPRKTIKVIKLAHMSVKDYLVSDQLKNGPASYFSINATLAHSLIAQTSLAYVYYLGNLPSIDASVFESFPLGTYAARYWMKHMRLGGGDGEHLSQMMDCIFSLEESAMANWVRFDDPDEPEWWRTRENPSMCSTQIAAPLYYACINDLQRIANQLLIGGADVNVQGGKYGSALQAASQAGHCAIVRLLLKKGADVNAQGGHYEHALLAASCRGYDTIVRLLLEQGADVNAQAAHCGSALQAASEGGHDALVRLLLDNGADVNARGGIYENALQATSARGHCTIIRVLLEHGANVNSPGGHYGNALQAASEGGHDALVRLLIDSGADVNAQGGIYANALQAASYHGHDVIVRLLLEQGADVNSQGGQYGNALQASSYSGHDAIVRLLLEQGADVNAQGGMYDSAAEAAWQRDHHEIWLLLCERRIPVAVVRAEESGNAPQAAYSGDDTNFELLHIGEGTVMIQRRPSLGTALKAAMRLPTLREHTVALLFAVVVVLLRWCIEKVT